MFHCRSDWNNLIRHFLKLLDGVSLLLHIFNFTGTVIRCSIAKLLEYERQFMCNKCRHVFTVEVEFEQNYNLPTPTSCPSPDGCNSYKFTEMKDGKGPSKCKDYQELKVQEQVKLSLKSLSRTIFLAVAGKYLLN